MIIGLSKKISKKFKVKSSFDFSLNLNKLYGQQLFIECSRDVYDILLNTYDKNIFGWSEIFLLLLECVTTYWSVDHDFWRQKVTRSN